MQYMFHFYLQIFTDVECGFLMSRGRFPSVNDFVPNPTNHIRICGHNPFCYPCL